jgi:mono/diheme cytochrome c family protein
MGMIRRVGALAAVSMASVGVLVVAAQDPAPRSTRDRVYSKEQADRGGRQYRQICARCHDGSQPVVPGKKPAPLLIGPAFLEQWQDRTLGELSTSIQTTMPSDGSAVLSLEETADIVAYLLQVNGFPDGPAALVMTPDARGIAIVK